MIDARLKPFDKYEYARSRIPIPGRGQIELIGDTHDLDCCDCKMCVDYYDRIIRKEW